MHCAVRGVAKSRTRLSDCHLHHFLAAAVSGAPVLGGLCPVFLHERNTACLWDDGLLASQPSAVLQSPAPPRGCPGPRGPVSARQHSVSQSFVFPLVLSGTIRPRPGAGSPPSHTDRQRHRGCGQVQEQGPCLRRARPHSPGVPSASLCASRE